MTHELRGRRHFLKLAAATVATTTASCLYNTTGGPSSVDTAAGNVSALPVGSLQAVGNSLCVGRDAGGVYAMSTICTHAGCDISGQGTISSSGLYCACHGSRFDPNGKVTRGPAGSPLQHYSVTVDAQGELTVHPATKVDASARLAV